MTTSITTDADAKQILRTTYKRQLPCPPAVAFSSFQGKRYLAEALAEGTAESFFSLIEQFHTQDEPAYCGLASIAMVLNALQVDPKRAWKGPWRWFHEKMLDCCKPLDEIVTTGINLEQAACLARCNGANTKLTKASDLSAQDFAKCLRETCSSTTEHIIVSYTRKQFLQTGDGHFSPIGAFHSASRSALILDVARFKYCPHWVPVDRLYEAMKANDPTTGKERGFMTLGTQIRPSSVLFSLNTNSRYVDEVSQVLETITLPIHTENMEDKVIAIASKLPLDSISSFLETRKETTDCHGCGECTQKEAVRQIIEEIHDTRLFRIVRDALKATMKTCIKDDFLPEKVSLVLLIKVKQMLQETPSSQVEIKRMYQLDDYHQILSAEASYIQGQIQELPKLQDAFPTNNGNEETCKGKSCCSNKHGK